MEHSQNTEWFKTTECPYDLWLELENLEHCQDYGERLSPLYCITGYTLEHECTAYKTGLDNYYNMHLQCQHVPRI